MIDNTNTIVEMIRKGDLDINVQELFLSALIKGLLLNLKNDIKIREEAVPHMIIHTGDDRLWLEQKGYDASIEPLIISNENNVYGIIPKCIVNLSNVDLDSAQLTSPYSIGKMQYVVNDGDYSGTYALKGEFRRIPIKMAFELKYYVESYTDMLELIQTVIANLAFIRTYDIIYMGQAIKCSYKIPDSFGEEHTMEIDGALSDSRDHSITLSLEVEANMPVFNNRTIMPASKIITTTVANIDFK
jgi:hypothetical protein